MWTDGIVIEVVKPLFQHLEHASAVKAFVDGQLIHFVVFQATDDSGGHIEVILVLHVTEAQQAAMHQCIDVVGEGQHGDVAKVEVTGQVAVIHTIRAFVHADGKNDGLPLADAVLFGEEIDFGLGGFQEVGTHLGVPGAFGDGFNGLQEGQGWLFSCLFWGGFLFHTDSEFLVSDCI